MDYFFNDGNIDNLADTIEAFNKCEKFENPLASVICSHSFITRTRTVTLWRSKLAPGDFGLPSQRVANLADDTFFNQGDF